MKGRRSPPPSLPPSLSLSLSLSLVSLSLSLDLVVDTRPLQCLAAGGLSRFSRLLFDPGWPVGYGGAHTTSFNTEG